MGPDFPTSRIQAYGVSKGIRVPVIDLYFLIRGGQTGVKHLVRPEYYDRMP
jgi:hypothetical protein